MIYFYLKRRLPTVILATFSALALALVSTITYTMLGPVFAVLGGGLGVTGSISFVELLGENIGPWIARIYGQPGVPKSYLWTVFPAFLAVASLIRAGLAIWGWAFWEKTSEQVALEMRSDLIRAYIEVDPEKRRDLNQEIDQEISSSISTDIRMVREFIVHFYGGFPRELISVIVYLILIFLLDWKLSLIFLVGIGPAAAILSRLGKKLRKRSQAVLGNTSILLEWLQQRMTGIETIKQFQTEYLEQSRMEKKSGELLKDFLRAARVKARTSPLLELVAIAAMVVVFSYALSAVTRNEMTSSVLSSFLINLGVMSQSASKLGRYFNSNKEGEAALNRLKSIMASMRGVRAETLPMVCKPEMPEALLIQNLSYAYDAKAPLALDAFSARYERGKIYAVAGPSGSGKSTLVKLLLGLWRPREGSIEFGIKGREELGYLPQHVQLVPGPLVSNIVYPEIQFDELKLKAALQKVGMLEYVEALPNSWHSIVGEGGDTTLSGGQAQRLKIARLIYYAYPLLIIDEGTSALDPEIEMIVLKTLKEMAAAGSTIIMIAHRVAVLQLADQVQVLKQGQTLFVGEPRAFLQRPDWRSYFETGAALVP